MVDLHLVSWNRPKMTELVIKTIHRNTNRNDFRLVVLDNGSEESTQQMIRDLADNGYIDEVFLLTDNIGLEGARQWLSKYTKTEYFVDIDNDCLPPANWLPDQLNLMEKYEDFAAISQRTPIMIGTGNIFEFTDATGMDITDFPHPGGSFRMMRTNAVKSVGGWDRESSGRGSEEKYICSKLRDAGYGTGFATFIECLHLFGDITTDNWGYDKKLKPEDTGHSSGVWHPVFASGDDYEEIEKYTGKELVNDYRNN